ncbi:uncharacterized protein TNCV_466801 [Trichonephila clavipes]|nr:uncharacterized protein TNCV_466801 [Trichonephila clavipes]
MQWSEVDGCLFARAPNLLVGDTQILQKTVLNGFLFNKKEACLQISSPKESNNEAPSSSGSASYFHGTGPGFKLRAGQGRFCLSSLQWVDKMSTQLAREDKQRRFVEWAQNEIAVVPDFHKRILFSDEAHFWLNGYVNKQNCRIWSEANPQVYVETPLHPEKLTVWFALWAGGILLQKR